ncbi:FecR family protein [Lysobacter sp. A378]
MIETAVARGPSVLESDNDNDYGPKQAPTARRRRFALAAIAVCLLATIAVAPGRLWPTKSSPTASHQDIDLADGSIVTLVGGARVAVEMTDSARTVTLQSHKAVFNVVKDPKRPFQVRSGGVFAQAVGTVYSVARVGVSGAAVKVSEGSVLVWTDGQADRAIILNAGDQVTLDPDATMPQALNPGQISLDNESILAAAKRFNRVNRTQIVVRDPAIGDVRVVGLFKANEPEHFAQAAAAIAGAKVGHGDGIIILEAQRAP